MLPQKTDEELINLFNTGNQEVFEYLVNKYTSPLYNFTARLTGKNNADDLVQEIFLKIWKNTKSFNPQKASFKTWVFTIAKNTTTDFLRKKKSFSFSDLENNNNDGFFYEQIPSDDLLPDEDMQKLEDKELLDNLLNQLRPNYKEVLVLHYQEEMTFDEIGKILSRPLNTVKSFHRRALIELRNMLN